MNFEQIFDKLSIKYRIINMTQLVLCPAMSSLFIETKSVRSILTASKLSTLLEGNLPYSDILLGKVLNIDNCTNILIFQC